MLAAQPVVAIDSATTPIGGEATINVSFDNVPDGSPGGDTGYAPYIDLILPQNGADGAGVGNSPINDGVSFVSASYLGAPVSSSVIEFNAAGQAIHPFARDAAGNLRVVNAADYGAAAGDQLVVLSLPFGSFVPEQPRADVQVKLQVSPFADLNVPLATAAVGGFAFGRDSLNNPTVDTPVLGAIATGSITPELLDVTKAVEAPEGETATGPNFPRIWTIKLDLAAGQTISNAVLTDLLPAGIVLTSPPILSGAPGTATYDPLTHSVTATIAGDVIGVAGPEVTVTIGFFVADKLVPTTPGTPVLDPNTGASRVLENNVSARADWTPLDPRDPAQLVVVDPPGPEAVITAKSLATQKSQALAIDLNAPGLGPLDTIEYTINIQVSDYFDLSSLVLNDRLSDGQRYLDGTASLEVLEGGSTAGSGSFDASNLVFVRDSVTGITTLRFDVADALVSNGAPDGVLIGGDNGLGPTTLKIVFRAVVEQSFLATALPVIQGKSIGNNADVAASVLDAAGVPTGGVTTDGTASSAPIATGTIVKEVYAINGVLVTPGAPLLISANDEVTFRLVYSLPQSILSDFRLTDFFPLPVFDVDGISLTLLDVVSAAPPAVNSAKWGPDAAGFDGLLTEAPIVTINSAQNSLTFGFKNLLQTAPKATTADILITLKVADRPFGDGLLLTNQVVGQEFDGPNLITSSTAIRQVTLTEPSLTLTKGVIATDNAQGDLAPGPVGPVGFTAPGTAGVRFAGEINSTNLALSPVNSDLSDIDAGDRVSFAIVVENKGSGIRGAFDIILNDTIPAGFAIPPGGLNLSVTNGAGEVLSFTGDLFGPGGLTISDPASGDVGALTRFSATGGKNILVITYDLVTLNAVQPRDSLVNTSAIENYAAVEGGSDRVPNSQLPVTDIATVRIGDPDFEKTAISTDVSQTGTTAGDDTLFDLTVGESITFELVATLREGTITGFVIKDQLPVSPGRLDFVSAELVSIGGNLRAVDALGNLIALGAPTITSSTNSVSFTFVNEIINLPDNLTNAADRIVVRVTAVLVDDPGNQPGTVVENTGSLNFLANGLPVAINDTAAAEVVGPSFAIVKNADRDTAQGGDTVRYTVDVTPVASDFAGPLFDIEITDKLFPGLDLVTTSLVITGAPGATVTAETILGVVTLVAKVPVLLPGQSIKITYDALVETSVVAGSELPNTVNLKGDSFPGTQPKGIERVTLLEASDIVRVPGPGIIKTVSEADTSLTETGSDAFNTTRPDLAIGEVVTYRITVTFPEAVSENVRVQDLLPGGFEFISGEVVRVGANVTGVTNGTAATGVDLNGDGTLDALFNLGVVTNSVDGSATPADQVDFIVTARVLNTAANVAGREAVNTGQVLSSLTSATSTASVDIVEPSIGLDKTASASTGDAGDKVTYSVTLPNGGPNDGPAFDVVAKDVIPVGLEIDVTTLVFTSAVPAGTTLIYDAATRTITVSVPVYLSGDPDITFTYDAIVANTVRPDEQLTNNAEVVFDSHPGDPGAQFQRDYGPVRDSTTFTVAKPELTKEVQTTDIPGTGTLQLDPALTDVAVGETITYLVTLRLPEGETTLVITDQLPRGLGLPPDAGTLELLGARVFSIGGNITTEKLGVGAAGDVSDSDGDGRNDRVQWDFGKVTNLGERETVASGSDDLIVVQITARLPNVGQNQPGDVLVNTGGAEYGRADGTTATVNATASVEVVGPELSVDKTAVYASGAATGDAGDIVNYGVTVAHLPVPGSTASAYKLDIKDLLDPDLELIVGSVTVSLAGAVIVRGNAAGDTTIEVTLDELARPDNPALPPQVLVITYQAKLTNAVTPGEVLPNTANVGWQSAPGGFPEARPDSGSGSASVQVALPLAFVKTIVETSLPDTGTGERDPTIEDVAIGEIITYRLVATLSEGTQTLVIADTLPPGLALISAAVTAVGSALPPTLLAIANSGKGQGLLFDFGTVVNPGNNTPADGTVTIEVKARVLNVPGNTATTVLTNAAQATVGAPGVPGSGQTVSSNVSAEVVLPDPVIVKSTPFVSGDAGDEVTYTVVVSQGAGATAPLYDLVITDAIPAGLELVAGSVTTSRGTIITGSGVKVDVSGLALAVRDDPGTPGVNEASITITYRAKLTDAVQPGQVIDNVAAFMGLTAPTTGVAILAREFAGNDDATVRVAMPVALDKTVIASSLPETPDGVLAVGETVTYRIVATLSEGTQSLVIRDTLPAGLELIALADAKVTDVGAGLPPGLLSVANTGSGNDILFDFGTVVNKGNNVPGDGTVTIEVLARVRDVPGNVVGTTLANDAEVKIASVTLPVTTSETANDSVTVKVVEPLLIIDKSAPPAFLKPGETITYTVTLGHVPASPAGPGSTSAAYDVVLRDLIADPNLSLVAGSVVTSRGTVTLGNAAGDTTMQVNIDVLALGETVTITFVARVAATAPPGASVLNEARVDYDSALGPGGRPGENTDGTQTPLAPGLAKEIIPGSTSNPDTAETPPPPQLAIGETLTYRLTVTLPLGTTQNLVISDLLPAALTPLDARLISTGGLVAGAPTITVAGQSVSLAFGTVVNGTTSAVDAEDVIVIEVDARVADVAGVNGGAALINAAKANFTIGGRDGELGVSAPALLVEPKLSIVKSVDKLTGDAGDVFTYTVVVKHQTGSTSPAYDVVVQDTLDGRFALIDVTPSAGTATITGQQVRLDLPRLLTSEEVTLTYRVRFVDAIEPGQVVGNTASLGFDSNPGPGGRPDTGTASAPAVLAVFGLDLVKSIIATSLPETGSSVFDPSRPDLAIGEIVTYQLVARLSEGTQRLVITDTMPEGLEPLPAGAIVFSTSAGISAGAGGTLTPTALISGRNVTFDFGTLVNEGDNISTGTSDRVIVQIQARVLDVPGNTNGKVVTNDGRATIAAPTDPGAPGGTVTDRDAVSAEIVLPELGLAKTVDRTGGDAGDVFTYTLTLTPQPPGTGPAYNVVIEDPLPATLALEAGSATTSFGTVTIVGNLVRLEIPVLLPGAAPVIITYRAAFTDAIEPGQVVPNRASLDYGTAPGGGRELTGDAAAQVRGDFVVGLAKEVVATSLPETGSGFFNPGLPDVAAGETVTYRLTATLSEGTQRLVITDTLPPGLIAQSASVVSLGGGITAGAPVISVTAGLVSFDFGTVVNRGDNIASDTVVVEIVARLNAGPDAGTVLNNTANGAVTSPTNPGAPGGTLTASAAAAAEAVAAVLVFDKQLGPASVSLGEAITYTLTLSHAGNSTAPAYDVVLSDPLTEASLQLIPGSVVVSIGGVVVSGNAAGDSGVLVTLPVLLPGQVLTVTFQARAIGIPVPDGIAPNTANVASTSAPGAVPPGFTRPAFGQDTAAVQITSSGVAQAGGLLQEFDDELVRLRQNALNAPPILVGTAQPGAAVSLALRDGNGAPITIVGLTADAGGHWLANPIASGTDGAIDGAAFDAVQSAAGRTSGNSGEALAAPSASPPSPTPTSAPYTVLTSDAPAAFDTRNGTESVRVTFTGAIQPGGFFATGPEAQAQVAAAPIAASVQRDLAANAAPTSLAWNRFALDFAASTAATSR